MTQKELQQLMHSLGLAFDETPQVAYIFYETADGYVHNLIVSLHHGRHCRQKALTIDRIAKIMQEYPSAAQGKLVAVEHPKEGLTRWMDASDVCRRMSTSRQTLRRWIKRGMLHPSRIGNRLYFDPAEVETMVRSNIIQENGRIDRSALGLREGAE